MGFYNENKHVVQNCHHLYTTKSQTLIQWNSSSKCGAFNGNQESAETESFA